MDASYAVVWREAEGPVFAGKLELGPRSLTLEGSAPPGRLSMRKLPYEELAEVRIGRSPEDRIEGCPSLVLRKRAGGLVHIAGVLGLGTVHELAERLAVLTAAAWPL